MAATSTFCINVIIVQIHAHLQLSLVTVSLLLADPLLIFYLASDIFIFLKFLPDFKTKNKSEVRQNKIVQNRILSPTMLYNVTMFPYADVPLGVSHAV